jgi:O-methyltransferase involved in polyketide biosynthesis
MLCILTGFLRLDAAHRMIGADLTDPGWLDTLPRGRPAVIVANGLMAFLTQDDLISLLDRLVGHFPSGEVAFNGYSRFAIWSRRGTTVLQYRFSPRAFAGGVAWVW